MLNDEFGLEPLNEESSNFIRNGNVFTKRRIQKQTLIKWIAIISVFALVAVSISWIISSGKRLLNIQ